MIIDFIVDIMAWMFGSTVKAGAARLPLTVRRIVAAIFSMVFGALTLLVLFNQLRAQLQYPASNYWPAIVIFNSFTATAAIFCGWFALRGHRPESRLHLKLTMRGGLIGGGIGFLPPFVGPLFGWGGNLGPLIGILVTGPIGLVLGAVIGWFYGRFRHEARIKPA